MSPHAVDCRPPSQAILPFSQSFPMRFRPTLYVWPCLLALCAPAAAAIDFTWVEMQSAAGVPIFSSGFESKVFANTTDLPIPDDVDAGVISTLEVSGPGSASAASLISVRIVHTFPRDLVVDLIAPSGNVYGLYDRAGGPGDNLEADFTVDLSGEPIEGTWSLRVADRGSLDTGFLDEWSIRF